MLPKIALEELKTNTFPTMRVHVIAMAKAKVQIDEALELRVIVDQYRNTCAKI
jgi:hypothetical protein